MVLEHGKWGGGAKGKEADGQRLMVEQREGECVQQESVQLRGKRAEEERWKKRKRRQKKGIWERR